MAVSVTVLVVSIALGAGAIVGCVVLLVPAASPLAHVTQAGHLPPLLLGRLPQRSVIYDRNKNVITQLYSDQDREPITIDQVPDDVVNAVLDTEDRNFFAHGGVDYKGIFRAFVRDIQAGGVRQGGSTITQQLVKNTQFASEGGRKKTAGDKAREAVLAVRLENTYSKHAILEAYLNTVYFGRGAYGIKAAAERWFDKPTVKNLTVPEAALLAGMISNPGGYDPISHPQEARDRRLQVLQFMAQQGHITWAEVDRYTRTPLPRTTYSKASIAPTNYFVEAMKEWLLDPKNNGPAQRALGPDRLATLYQGGLSIYTTFDPALQTEADDAARTKGPPYDPTKPGGAIETGMAVIDNTTGAVRALVGGPETPTAGPGGDYATQKVDIATQGGFQPGSSFKTFTLTTALENGYSPNDEVNGSPTCTFPYELSGDPKGYTVKADGPGVATLRQQIAHSINCAFVRLIIALGADKNGQPATIRAHAGPQRVIDVAHRLGITTPTCPQNAPYCLAPVPSLTLGASSVTPLDMADAYSTIASDGVRHDVTYVSKIVAADGTVLYDAPGSAGKQVLAPQIARTVTDMLKGVIKFGTASGNDIGRPAAGKTGTTDGRVSVWFVGYTPQLTVAVAVAKPKCGDNSKPECSIVATDATQGYGITRDQAFGGSEAAGIWKAFMLQAMANLPVLDFPAPDPTLWPAPSYFDENGRRNPGDFIPPPATTTTTPGTTPPASTTTTTARPPSTTTAPTTVPVATTTTPHT